MTQIVDAPKRRDAGGTLGGFPVAVAEVVQIEVTAAKRGKQQRALIGGQLFECGECDRLQWHGSNTGFGLSRPFRYARRT
jgi:hypothetical protein